MRKGGKKQHLHKTTHMQTGGNNWSWRCRFSKENPVDWPGCDLCLPRWGPSESASQWVQTSHGFTARKTMGEPCCSSVRLPPQTLATRRFPLSPPSCPHATGAVLSSWLLPLSAGCRGPFPPPYSCTGYFGDWLWGVPGDSLRSGPLLEFVSLIWPHDPSIDFRSIHHRVTCEDAGR